MDSRLGNSVCKGPEVGTTLACSMNKKDGWSMVGKGEKRGGR